MLPDFTASSVRCPTGGHILALRMTGGSYCESLAAWLCKMKISFSRSSILTTLVILLVLATLPGQIRRLVQTGDPYLFTRHFFQDMFARLSGPGRLRFLLQPGIAILLGMRDGKRDARRGFPPFLSALLHSGMHRLNLLRDAVASIRDLVAIAVILDLISQFLIFREIHPGAALFLGPVLIFMPYALSRALTNRIVGWRRQRMPMIPHS